MFLQFPLAMVLLARRIFLLGALPAMICRHIFC
jgi:hypothetical protein